MIQSKRSGIQATGTLIDQILNWPMASARDHKGSLPLEARDQAANWPTPRVITGGGESAERKKELGRMEAGGGDLQSSAENFPSSRPVRTTSTHGGASSKSTRRLNPRFVEWLMGWPAGWTEIGCSATELSRFKRRMRSCLYGLLSAGVTHDASD